MSTTTYVISAITILYGLIILFVHKASVRFHKMDEKVGNVESAEPTFRSCSIMNNNLFEEERENEEELITEKQDIY